VSFLTALAAFVLPLVAVLVLANLLGWLSTRAGPFNWRVLVGGDHYYRWLERRRRRN